MKISIAITSCNIKASLHFEVSPEALSPLQDSQQGIYAIEELESGVLKEVLQPTLEAVTPKLLEAHQQLYLNLLKTFAKSFDQKSSTAQ